METITVNQDDNKINKLVNQTIENNQPILLKGEIGNAVLISEKDWNAIQETLYLQSIPNLLESIKKGGETPLEDCIDEAVIRNILNG
ncbi:MAG TPA: type II toxin-antitoxin system Phd/YefM family antitoxin [Candidatus Obscuribacterales bacterium]